LAPNRTPNRKPIRTRIHTCRRPLRGSLHGRIPVRIGVRFGAPPISHTIRIGTKFIFDNNLIWTRFNFSGNIIFPFIFWEMSFLPPLSSRLKCTKSYADTYGAIRTQNRIVRVRRSIFLSYRESCPIRSAANRTLIRTGIRTRVNGPLHYCSFFLSSANKLLFLVELSKVHPSCLSPSSRDSCSRRPYYIRRPTALS
jgi:hypothetical protein